MRKEYRFAWSAAGGVLILAFIALATLAWQAGNGKGSRVPEPAFALFVAGALLSLYLMIAPLMHLPPYGPRASSERAFGGVRIASAGYGTPQHGWRDVTPAVRGRVVNGRLRMNASNDELVGSADPIYGVPKFLAIRYALDGKAQEPVVFPEDDAVVLPLPKGWQPRVEVIEIAVPELTDASPVAAKKAATKKPRGKKTPTKKTNARRTTSNSEAPRRQPETRGLVGDAGNASTTESAVGSSSIAPGALRRALQLQLDKGVDLERRLPGYRGVVAVLSAGMMVASESNVDDWIAETEAILDAANRPRLLAEFRQTRDPPSQALLGGAYHPLRWSLHQRVVQLEAIIKGLS